MQLAMLIHIALLISLITLPTFLPAAPQTDLKQLQKEIAAARDELEASEETKSDVLDQLKESEQAISQVNRSIRVFAQQERRLETSIKSLQSEIKKLQTDIDQAQIALGQVLYQQYLYGGQDYLKILLSHEDPNQTARQLRYYTYISRARANLIKSLSNNVAQLQTLTQEALQKKAELEANKRVEAEERQQLLKIKRERLTVLAGLKQEIQSRRGQIERLQKDEQRLQKLIARLGRVLSPRPTSPSRSPGKSLFYAQKGRLPTPIDGELVNRFGASREDSGAPWKGLFFKTQSGARVKAVAPGQVVFADWLRGFGNLIIVDHGEGYMSLYGNNEALYKQVGEAVDGAETIAMAGNSGGNPESGLYFELRFQSKPLNPSDWLRLK